MVTSALKEAEEAHADAQQRLAEAQKREERIEHVITLVRNLGRNGNRPLLTVHKLLFYLYGEPVVTLTELVQLTGDQRFLEYTPEHLRKLEKQEYNKRALKCLERIRSLASDAHYSTTLEALRRYNRKGSNLISEEEIAALEPEIRELKLRAMRKKLSALDNIIGGWADDRLSIIEEVVLFMEENELAYEELGEAEVRILERCMAAY